MKREGNQEIYRVAHDAATAELLEITAEFDRLRARKDLVEKLITVLRPVIGEEEVAPTLAVAPAANETTAQERPQPAVAEPEKKEHAAQPLGVSADPFQRRMDHVLGIGAGIRDVRQYTRQF